ncbi:pimeloyl-ACP methyl ester carboxylesterase [Lipingzhangella halophila]|uniref:Pimeloyl-ACP methyl ester carboxylesterase n=1 Tax=Lipingzhangella halophila TaxID=1783352 RepID=A0A7W7RE90_9ACTN|nr:alpha/beta hydrolase [Lipingzhangella halophila]MBB4930053.1 pimeloyl-ACP methyl ester carboxylesterase [Lipingzhangella halophila]
MTPLRSATDRISTVRAGDGAELRVLTRGPDSAPLTVVLAHGWLLSSDIWSPQASHLASVPDVPLRIIRFDHRGHGGSTRGTRPFDVGLLGEDLSRVLDAHAPSGPLVLGGHCLGGMAIMALAGARPELFAERVAGTLLAATSAGGPDPGRPEVPLPDRAAARGRHAAMRLLSHLPAGVDLMRVLVPPHLRAVRAAVRSAAFGSGADPRRVRECANLVHGTPAESLTGLYAPLTRLDLTERLGPLRDVPVTILAGGRDRLIPPRHGRALSRALPEARVRFLPHNGHLVPLEAPDVVSGHLAELCGAGVAESGAGAA